MNEQDKPNNPKGILPPVETQEAVRALVLSRGEFGAANALKISRQTLARVGCGLSVQRSTLGVVEAYLARGAAA